MSGSACDNQVADSEGAASVVQESECAVRNTAGDKITHLQPSAETKWITALRLVREVVKCSLLQIKLICDGDIALPHKRVSSPVLTDLTLVIVAEARCAHCDKDIEFPLHMQICSGCMTVCYCGRQCQLGHWGNHKSACQHERLTI